MGRPDVPARIAARRRRGPSFWTPLRWRRRRLAGQGRAPPKEPRRRGVRAKRPGCRRSLRQLKTRRLRRPPPGLLPLPEEAPPPPSRTSAPAALETALDELAAATAPPIPSAPGLARRAGGDRGFFYAAARFRARYGLDEGPDRPARAALARLERAAEDGLDLAFALPRNLAAGLAPDALAHAEAAIASAVVAYAEQASGSRVPPYQHLPAHHRQAGRRRSASGARGSRRRPTIPAPSLRISTRRKKAIASCARNSAATRASPGAPDVGQRSLGRRSRPARATRACRRHRRASARRRAMARIRALVVRRGESRRRRQLPARERLGASGR